MYFAWPSKLEISPLCRRLKQNLHGIPINRFKGILQGASYEDISCTFYILFSSFILYSISQEVRAFQSVQAFLNRNVARFGWLQNICCNIMAARYYQAIFKTIIGYKSLQSARNMHICSRRLDLSKRAIIPVLLSIKQELLFFFIKTDFLKSSTCFNLSCYKKLYSHDQHVSFYNSNQESRYCVFFEKHAQQACRLQKVHEILPSCQSPFIDPYKKKASRHKTILLDVIDSCGI